MTYDERLNLIFSLDAELLVGGTILSEWCSFIIREADAAFCAGANLASILTAVAGIEAFLRAESCCPNSERLVSLIEECGFDAGLKIDLHKLRKYRNAWVHVSDPWDDSDLQNFPENKEAELEEMAIFAAKVLRKTVYQNQSL